VPFCFGVGLGYLLGARGSRRMGWYGAMGVVNDTTTEFSIDERDEGEMRLCGGMTLYMEKQGKGWLQGRAA
jgi:hypothetical protein